MFVATLLQGLVKFFEQFALMLGELDRRFHRDVAIQIAREAGAQTFDALATQAELLVVLCAFRNVDGCFACQCGHTNFATQSRSGEADGHCAMQVVTIAFEDVVFLDANLDEQIAGWATVGAGLAVASAANAHAVVDARRNFDFECFLRLDLALAVTGVARGGNDLD